MRKFFRNLPLFKKVLLFSFFITFLVVVSTAGISIGLQTKQMKDQLTDRVSGLSSLWSTTISAEDVQRTIQTKDKNDPAYKSLVQKVSLINEKNSTFFHGDILFPHLKDKEVFVIVTSKGFEEKGMTSFEYFKAPKEYTEGMLKAVYTDQVASSGLYEGHNGIWITAFSPIKDSEGNTVAVLGIDADASVIKSFKNKLTYYISIIFFVITLIVYFILRKGLNKTLEPVNEIITGINEVSNGNFGFKLPVEDQSDLGLLFERFNFMTEQLSKLFERLTLTSEQFGNEKKQLTQISKFEDAIGKMDNIIQKTKLLKELQRAEKMNAIGQLAASVAHEIRNPMTVVKGFLQIFLAKEELSAEEHMYIKLMIDEMDRAETIINDYLSLAKPDLENTARVDAKQLANKAMDLISSYAMMSKNIELKSVVNDNFFIKGNQSELQQVLINILKNGIEAMKDGGVLTLKILKNEGFGVFEIQDTGIGMSKEELERLGTPFYSLKEKGTGMGLMVCYQIVERMKGSIDVISQKGKGTTFRISVPLNDNE